MSTLEIIGGTRAPEAHTTLCLSRLWSHLSVAFQMTIRNIIVNENTVLLNGFQIKYR